MKQKLLSALVVAAVAGMAVNANAGVIQASYKNYAAEVFKDNTVSLTAPTINYSLATPLSGTVGNPNQFSVSWTLSDGAVFSGTLPDAKLSGPNSTNVLPATTVTLDATGTVLTANFSVNNGINYTVGSQITLGSVNTTTLSKVAKLGSNFNNCAPAPQYIDVTIKLTNAAGDQFDHNVPGAPLLMSTHIAQSSPAINIQALSSSAYSAVTTNNELSQVNVLTGSLGKFFTNPTDITNSTSVIEIGQVVLSDLGVFFDLTGDPNNVYSVGGAATWGPVAQNGLTFKVTGKFAPTTTAGVVGKPLDLIILDPNNANAVVPATITYNASNTEATVEIDAAAAAALKGAGGKRAVRVQYPVDTFTVIPTSQFAISGGTLFKTSGSKQIDDNVCPGALYNLTANGVQIDVRNYVPAVVTDATQWKSVVRVINTDASQTAIVIGQVLHRSGKLGASATLRTLAPNEVVYLINAEIDAKLNAAATNALTSFDADDASGSNARLRLTSNNSSLRVQNYLYNPANGNFIEGSSAQGDEGPDYQQLRNITNK